MIASAKIALKRLLYPFRTFLGRFIVRESDDAQTIFFKAGCFTSADKIVGDYLEFGVFSGYAFASAFRLIQKAYKNSYTPSIWNTEQDRIERRKLWEKMRFIAFDSFQGLPKLAGIDLLSTDFVEGKFSNSAENFAKYISASGVPLDRVQIVPGWFNETLNTEAIKKHNLKHAAIIHIDCDLYESAKLVLDFIEPLLVDGSVIVFDDWYSFKGNPNLGEQRAFREWSEKNPQWLVTQYQQEGAWRNSFIVNKVAVI